MGTGARSGSLPSVTITRSDGKIVAKDEDTDVASQGDTRAEALENLAEALRLHEKPEPDDADEPAEPSSAPWFRDT